MRNSEAIEQDCCLSSLRNSNKTGAVWRKQTKIWTPLLDTHNMLKHCYRTVTCTTCSHAAIRQWHAQHTLPSEARNRLVHCCRSDVHNIQSEACKMLTHSRRTVACATYCHQEKKHAHTLPQWSAHVHTAPSHTTCSHTHDSDMHNTFTHCHWNTHTATEWWHTHNKLTNCQQKHTTWDPHTQPNNTYNMLTQCHRTCAACLHVAKHMREMCTHCKTSW